jgi:hypothetical protein
MPSIFRGRGTVPEGYGCHGGDGAVTSGGDQRAAASRSALRGSLNLGTLHAYELNVEAGPADYHLQIGMARRAA